MKKNKILDNILTTQISIDKVIVKDRIRKDIGDITDIKKSIKLYGQLNPLIIDEKNRLIAGERRYRAMKSLGFKTVEVKIIHHISDYDRLSLELDENSTRKEFSHLEFRQGVEKQRLLKLRKESFWRYLLELFRLFFKRQK